MSLPSSPSSALDLPLVVLRNQVVFPGDTVAVDVIGDSNVAVVAALEVGGANTVVLATQRDPSRDEPRIEGVPAIGVLARVVERSSRAAGGFHMLFESQERVALTKVTLEPGQSSARAVRLINQLDEVVRSQVARAIAMTADLIDSLPPEGAATFAALSVAVHAVGETMTGERVSRFIDLVGNSFAISVEERLALLQAADLDLRLDLLEPILVRKRAWNAEVQRFVVPSGAKLPHLWPLEPDGLERIQRERSAGRITDEEAADLVHYVEKGFVLWERLIEPSAIDELVADVRTIAQHPGCFLSTDHRRGFGFRFTDAKFDEYESIFDTYINFESARQIAFHPRVLRFLEILFEAPPIAMQQLLFQRSNQHPMHQDTAYVRVQQPLHLAATWVALEDVVEGRGELVYYEGSHRIPHQIFSDDVKWFNLERDSAEAAVRYVVGESERLGCEKRHFLAKKGDVFLWAADLVHGSAPRTRPDEETRLSCVTHFVPKTAQPLWFMFSPDRRGLEPCGPRAFLASSHYELPRHDSAMQRPTFKSPLPS